MPFQLNSFKISLPALLLALVATSCKKDASIGTPTLKQTPYSLQIPTFFPKPDVPSNNPMTVEGVKLGRMLFYDPILSSDGSISCNSCHKQENAFADPRRFSLGVGNTPGKRNAPPLFNLAYDRAGLFWDGREPTIESQVLQPIQNPIEMHEVLPSVISKLKGESKYQALFDSAFGKGEVTSDKVSKALAQFIRTMISGSSRFDQYFYKGQQNVLNESEKRGLQLFLNDPVFDNLGNVTKPGADCFHCHSLPNFAELAVNLAYANNGLEPAQNVQQFSDFGKGGVTGVLSDYGKFRIPSLRNVEVTAPYMHDGRFQTLDQVVDHYNRGGLPSPTLDSRMPFFQQQKNGGQLYLTDQDKRDLIAFLKTLTDQNLLHNKEYANPF